MVGWYLTDRAPALAGDGAKTAAYCAKALLVHLTGKRISELTPAVLAAYERERGKARATIRRELSVLAAAIVDATEAGALVGAPPVKLPAAPPGRTRNLTEDEIRRLLDECEGHLRLFVLLALNTGARRAAILDLTWPQIDFMTGVIDLNPPGRVQTAKRRPKVPMSETLLETLRRTKATATSEYVVSWRGQPIAAVKTALGKAAARAGVPDVSSHVLRHTAGTLMAKAGIPLWQIGEILGQSQVATTALYAHFSPDFGREAVAVLGRATG